MKSSDSVKNKFQFDIYKFSTEQVKAPASVWLLGSLFCFASFVICLNASSRFKILSFSAMGYAFVLVYHTESSGIK